MRSYSLNSDPWFDLWRRSKLRAVWFSSKLFTESYQRLDGTSLGHGLNSGLVLLFQMATDSPMRIEYPGRARDEIMKA